MEISKRLKELARTSAKDVAVLDVRIGLRYTAVRLDNGQVGLAFTFHKDSMGGCSALRNLSPLAGKKASELLTLFGSTEKVESAVALATSNALSNTKKDGLVEGDVLKHLRLSPDDRVGMVGYFGPAPCQVPTPCWPAVQFWRSLWTFMMFSVGSSEPKL